MIKIGIIMGLLGTFLNTACSYFSGLGYPVDKSNCIGSLSFGKISLKKL
jgi:hypothetical protein